MKTIEKGIEVAVPDNVAYNQWTQFEEFPRFMKDIVEVKQLDDTRLYWRAEIGGQHKEWEALITEQIPDKRIAWTSVNGPYNAGVVTFHKLNDNSTRIMLQLGYALDGILENIGDAMGIIARQVEGDLQRFKEFIETRSHETGAWRGTVTPV